METSRREATDGASYVAAKAPVSSVVPFTSVPDVSTNRPPSVGRIRKDTEAPARARPPPSLTVAPIRWRVPLAIAVSYRTDRQLDARLVSGRTPIHVQYCHTVPPAIDQFTNRSSLVASIRVGK